MNAIAQAERKTQLGKAPAYMYYFAYDTPMDGGKYRAFHTAELPLVLRLVRYPNSDPVSKQLAGAWAAFARHGNPNHKGLANWAPYNLEQRATMVFTETDSHQENDPLREARLKYLSLPAPGRGGRRGLKRARSSFSLPPLSSNGRSSRVTDVADGRRFVIAFLHNFQFFPFYGDLREGALRVR